MLKTNFTPCKPCAAFTIPTSFAKCITYMEQVWYLYVHKQSTLIAGVNIKLTDNDDGTTTISASGEIQGEKYLIKTITPPEHYVAAYELVTEAGEKAGVDILIPDQSFDSSNLESEIAALQNSLNSVNTSVASLQTDMTTAKADITGLKQSVKNIDTNIVHLFDDKQNKLTAGTNISIEDNVISTTYVYDDTEIVSDIHALETETAENGKAIQANTNSIDAINTSISSINSTLTNKQDRLTAGVGLQILENVIGFTDNPPVGQLINSNVQINDAVGYNDADLPVTLTINSQSNNNLRQYLTHVFDLDKSGIRNYVNFNGIKTLSFTPTAEYTPRTFMGNYNKYQFDFQMALDVSASELGVCGFGIFNDNGSIIYGYLRQQQNSDHIFFTAFDPSQFVTLTPESTYYITMLF